MIYKLSEVYNTRYFYKTFGKDLTYMLNTILTLRKDKNYAYNPGNDLLESIYKSTIVGAPVEIDLAGCKLTPDVTKIIHRYALQGIVFVDSKDSWRDEILAINRERAGVNTDAFVELPKYEQKQLIKEYIDGLDENVTYKMPVTDSSIYIPLVCMIMIYRPSININISAHCSDFFNFVGSRLTIEDIEPYDEMYLTTQDGTQIVNFAHGDIYVQRVGMANKEKALTAGTLVPTVFGRKKLLDIDCWYNLFAYCLNTLNGYRATRAKTLDEILESYLL